MNELKRERNKPSANTQQSEYDQQNIYKRNNRKLDGESQSKDQRREHFPLGLKG